jgi:uncharacterized protein involved in cysteine biosynthesis
VTVGLVELEEKPAEPLVLGADPRCPRCGAHLVGAACARCGLDPRARDVRDERAPLGPVAVELVRGASYLPRGAFALATHPRLWGTVAIPILVNVLAAIVLQLLVVPSLIGYLKWLTAPDTLASWTGWLAVPRHALELLGWSTRIAGPLVGPGLTAWLLTAPPLRQVFAAAGVFVSDAVERERLGIASRLGEAELLQREKSAAAAVLGSIALALLETAALVVLMPVALIPLAGSFVWLMGPRFAFAGIDALDPVLGRKLYASAEKVALVRARRWRLLGLGATALALLGLPYVNGVVLPVASAAAALLYLELDVK